MHAKQRIAQTARTLVIASGKGGVGKTTVSVNLALALAGLGARVGIFDADIYGPNVPLMLGVRRSQSARGLLPIARASSEPYIDPLERYGLQIMSIGLVVGESDAVMPDPHDAGRIVTQTLRDVRWNALDYLLIDLPPGTGEPQHSLVRAFAIDGAVVVTTPQDLSLLDASRSLGLFRQAQIAVLGVIENMSYLICPHCGEQIEVFARSPRQWAVHDTALPQLGRIPMDIAISRGIDAGHPLVQARPDAPDSQVFRTIAATIAQLLAR
ncbi:MAG TPA: P-loop NTPase [Kouleothrix sp.]|uniref:P-loop NTPase n=1 Tax=Kouleothrix sp. TaxID=2779161 RepID=UPI002B779749|nr:P-loop NTPase [Kouleothrix sp.]HRC74090.1 P-loop NTPase [Kouleothrix sp.]